MLIVYTRLLETMRISLQCCFPVTRARNGLAGVLVEDARLTALFLWTLQSVEPGDGENEEEVAKASAGGFSLPYDVVRRFTQPMGIDLDAWAGRIIELCEPSAQGERGAPSERCADKLLTQRSRPKSKVRPPRERAHFMKLGWAIPH